MLDLSFGQAEFFRVVLFVVSSGHSSEVVECLVGVVVHSETDEVISYEPNPGACVVEHPYCACLAA